ncbi:1,2-dihydroxy-3-keto-5-methylthiopentene dioxygenase [Coemansia sp. RSA 2424]|nr:1,2-dihydroxy-3-keto-5-methylthiopentene dioxygenase [Coemansia sp. RSA 2424]
MVAVTQSTRQRSRELLGRCLGEIEILLGSTGPAPRTSPSPMPSPSIAENLRLSAGCNTSNASALGPGVTLLKRATQPAIPNGVIESEVTDACHSQPPPHQQQQIHINDWQRLVSPPPLFSNIVDGASSSLSPSPSPLSSSSASEFYTFLPPPQRGEDDEDDDDNSLEEPQRPESSISPPLHLQAAIEPTPIVNAVVESTAGDKSPEKRPIRKIADRRRRISQPPPVVAVPAIVPIGGDSLARRRRLSASHSDIERDATPLLVSAAPTAGAMLSSAKDGGGSSSGSSSLIDAATAAHSGDGWQLKKTFIGHMDTVRALGVRSAGGGGPQVVSGADDGMVVLWDVERSDRRKSRRQRTSGDVVPTTMYRGHLAAVTSVAFAEGHDFAYSGSLDSSIKVWSLSSQSTPMTDDTTGGGVEACFPVRGFSGHSDAVWDLALSPGADLLASVAADATCCLWSTDQRHANIPLRATLIARRQYPAVQPTSTCFVSSGDSSSNSSSALQLAVAYVDGSIDLYDVATAETFSAPRLAMSIGADADDISNARITRMASAGGHCLAAACVSGDVQMADVRIGSGSGSKSGSGSVAVVVRAYAQSGVAATAVDLCSDGVLLVTGGSNGVVKWWDRRNLRSAVHEDRAAHTPKADEGVCDVRIWSPTIVVSGGSDGLARLYQQETN